MDTISLAELEQHAGALRNRIRNVSSDIRALLADDLPLFAEREMKKAFINNPEFASTVPDNTLKQLKADITKESASAAAAVLGALDDESLWFAANTEAPTSIADNQALWAQVNQISAMVNSLREQYNFPPNAEPIVYRPPTWFIGGRYMPTLSEKYWAALSQLWVVDAQIAALETDSSKSELSQRWDKS
jgi:hypothetical protein